METITKKAIDGKEFTLAIAKHCKGQKSWYIMGADHSELNTKQKTIELANLCIDNRIEDYEYDNDLR